MKKEIKVKKVQKNPEPYILKLWPENEMAEIWQGNRQVFLGNYWDFHPGCHGTTMWVNDKFVDIGSQWGGTHSLAQLLAAKAKSKVVVKEYKTPWNG